MRAGWIQASYGGVDLLVSTLESDGGRDIAVQSPSRGDRHVLQDRGLKLRSSRCTIRFIDQPGKADYLARFDQFRTIAETDGSSVFSHPLLGTYLARVSDFQVTASDDGDEVSVTCTIIAEEEPQVVFRVSAGVSAAAGLGAVSAATAGVNAELASLGLSSSTPLDCLNAATAWAEGDDLDSQAVFQQIASLTGQIDTAIDDLDLLGDLSRWQAYQQMILLRYQLTRAAEAATSDADHVFDLLVSIPRPLRAICAEVYGGSLAAELADRIAKLNRIRAPGLVAAGTLLKMISEGARA